MVGVAGPAGTYELFAFGGADQTSSKSYNDLYVLSLPGFVWFQAAERSVETRANAACVLIGNHQMLVVGGHDFTGSGTADRYWQTQDPFPQGLGLFNMTAMSWVKDYTYHADAQPYKSPQVVEDWYKNNTNLSFAMPWSSMEVKDMFLAKPVLFNNSNSNSTTSVGSNKTTTSSNKVGSIAGGVVGAFIGTAILLSLIYYLWIGKQTPTSLMELGSHEDSPSSNTKAELSTEPLVMEMPGTPPEGTSREETHEVDARNDIYELDVTSCACELDVPNRTCAGDVTSQVGDPVTTGAVTSRES
ncbi:hypothetical protein N0V85_000960 [Neurospora sp. IMI 360204]|nr:hypothetical protein N0V85_000960 [Neurospora sp. IMI 360204]